MRNSHTQPSTLPGLMCLILDAVSCIFTHSLNTNTFALTIETDGRNFFSQNFIDLFTRFWCGNYLLLCVWPNHFELETIYVEKRRRWSLNQPSILINEFYPFISLHKPTDLGRIVVASISSFLISLWSGFV